MAEDWATKKRCCRSSESMPGPRPPYTEKITHRFRSRRMAKLERLLAITPSTRILDVGGTPANWSLLRVCPKVTIVNLPRAREPGEEGFPWIFADGCHLPFRDKSFDVVFSNSVIEHVGDATRHDQ